MYINMYIDVYQLEIEFSARIDWPRIVGQDSLATDNLAKIFGWGGGG